MQSGRMPTIPRRERVARGLGKVGRLRPMLVLYMAIAVTMGCFLAIQAGVNGRLRLRTGDPVYAALISTSISTCSLLLYSAVVVRKPLPDTSRLTSAPVWIWSGGLLGATLVVTSLVLIARLGGAV